MHVFRERLISIAAAVAISVSFIFLLSAPHVQAQTNAVGYVRQDCASASNCYTSLAAWEANYGGIDFGSCTPGDLVCADVIATAQIDRSWNAADTQAVTMNGWITDSAHYIRIYTTSAARHTGKEGTGYRLVTSGAYSPLSIYEDNVRLEGLEIQQTGQTSGVGVYITSTANTGDIRISNSIIHGDSAAGRGIWNYSFGGTLRIWNNILYSVANVGSAAAIHNQGAGSMAYLYNNTIGNTIAGFGIRRSDGTVIVKNNLVRSTAAAFYPTGGFSASSSNNASHDATAPGINVRINQTFGFANQSGNDFRLTASDSTARDQGISLAGDSAIAFSDDIDGTARAGSWDIGADEVSGATTLPPTPEPTPDPTPDPTPTSDTQAPSVPASVIATAISQSSVSMSWSASSDNVGVSGYRVYRNGSLITTTSATSATDSGLTAGTAYSYTLAAYDAAGNTSSLSSAALATTLTADDTPPPPPPPSPPPPSSSGTVYYVDFDSGVDTNNGTSVSTPWKHAPGDSAATGNPATIALPAGSVIQFKGGVNYRGNIAFKHSGTAAAPITYAGQGWGSGKAIMDGSNPLSGSWTRCASAAACGNNANWQNIHYLDTTTALTVFTPLYENGEFLWFSQDPNPADPFWYDDLSNYRRIPQGSASIKYTSTSLTDPTYFTQSDASYWNGAYIAIWRNPNYVSVTPVRSYNPTTHTVTYDALEGTPYTDRDSYYSVINHLGHLDRQGEYSFNPTAKRLYVWPRNAASLSQAGITVGTRKKGFSLDGRDNLIIDGFRIQGYFGDIGQSYYGVGVFNEIATAQNIIIRNNDITKLRSMKGHGGITLSYVDNVTIQNNTIFENQKNSGMLIQTSSNNLVIDNNTVRKVGYVGIWFNGTVSRSRITNNTISEILGVHANGISTYLGYSDVLIANNYVYNAHFPMTFHGQNSGQLTIYGNVLVGTSQTSFVVNSWGKVLKNVRILNNVMYNGSNGGLSLDASDVNMVVKNNIIHGFGNGDTRRYGSWDVSHNVYTKLSWNQTSQYNWALRTGEKVETDLSKVFVNAAAGDFRLQANSPALNAGTDVRTYLPTSVFPTYNFAVDRAGATRPTGAWDMGAYEYGSSTPPPSPPSDTTPPARSSGAPSGSLAANTTTATLSLNTNEAATCRYATTANTAYAAMTALTATGGTTHSRSLTGLTNGTAYAYYIRCSDAAGNANSDDYAISFSVANVVVTNRLPQGSVDAADSTHVAGWAYDADAGVSPIMAHIYVDGVNVGTASAVLGRADLTAVVGDPNHGFNYTLPTLSVGTHTIRVYAINTPTGTNPELGGSPKTVTIAAPDITPPTRTNGAPAGILPADRTSTTITLTTSEAATCRYGTSANTAYAALPVTMAGSGSTSHGVSVTGLTSGLAYTYYVRCVDTAGNTNADDYTIRFSVATLADTQAPVISAGAPSGTLAAHTSSATWTVATNENSTCKYATAAQTPYASMSGVFTTTGGTSHAVHVTDLANGAAYSYYVRCRDAASNVNTVDYVVSFAVAIPPPPADTTAPVRTAGLPSGELPLGTTAAQLKLVTNENATCRYATATDLSYAALPFKFETTGTLTHITSVTGLENGRTYTYAIRCTDAAGNKNSSDYIISFSIEADLVQTDTTPPLRQTTASDVLLPVGTTATTLDATTDENATCRYALSATVPFADMSGVFDVTGERAHSLRITGLTNGQTTAVYVRCSDATGNANTDDMAITITVNQLVVTAPPADTPTPTPTQSSGGGGGGGGGGGDTTTAPVKPVAFTAIVEGYQVTLGWQNPSQSFAGVQIIRSTAALDTSLPVALLVKQGSVIYEGIRPTFTDTMVESGTQYYYYIVAYDQDGHYSTITRIDVVPVEGKAVVVRDDAAPASSVPTASGSTAITSLAGLGAPIVESISSAEAAVVYAYDTFVTLTIAEAKTYDTIMSGKTAPLAQSRYSIAYFIHAGTLTTQRLGANERAGVVNSYYSAYGHFPQSAADWQDLIKIASGRWTTQRNAAAEKEAAALFRRVYLRVPRDSGVDQNAVMVIAYGLRPVTRSMTNERAAIISFRAIFGRYPKQARDWDVMRAIAYSGARK